MGSDLLISKHAPRGRHAHATGKRVRLFLIVAVLALFPGLVRAVGPASNDSPAAFRTDSANPQLSWYQLKPGEFPPVGSEHRVQGELIAADFIHRTGQFRSDETHGLVNFSLLPYSLVYYLNAEADLRDIPLGTHLEFYLYQDTNGDFTKAVVIHDRATRLTDHGLEESKDGAAQSDADPSATQQQRKKHTAFIKQRGLAARVDRVEGKNVVVTLLGDPAGLRAFLKDERIEPEKWVHHGVKAAVANEELRTYNPPVDNEASEVLEYHALPTDRYGCSGIQWTIRPSLLLEGFRKGRIVRIFADYSWPIEDMPCGESLYTERPGAKMEEESPNQYSYRTDFGNEDLPWYQLKPGEFAPWQSQHVVTGELLKVDAARRSGQFRADMTGALVDFTIPPFGAILYCNADAELADLPAGRRYQFYLYQDEKKSFTRAAVVMDEFTRLRDEKLTCRVENVDIKAGVIFLAYQLDALKDDRDHLLQPPDLGRAQFGIDSTTRVWKGNKPVTPADIAIGDALIVNISGSTGTSISRCTDIWDGPEAQKLAADERRAKHAAFIKQNGMPGWIESVDGKKITIAFFAGRRRDFLDIKQGEPWGQSLLVKLLDDNLCPLDVSPEKMGMKENLPERNTAGTYGSAGVRWTLESEHLPETYRPGRVVRVVKPEWMH